MSSKITIQTIATEAGVSKATVSRVFNGTSPEKIGPEVRKRVEAVIRKYGYSPSIHAKGLACGKSSLIGIQLLSMTSPLSNVEIIEALEKAADDKNYNIILGISGWDHQRETRSINVMIDKGVDGIIWQPVEQPNPELLKKISDKKYPLVWCNKDCNNGFPGAFNDEIASGRIAFESLVELGCQRPLFIGFAKDPHTALRYQGWTEAGKNGSVSGHQILINDSSTETLKAGFDVITNIFNNSPREFDGVFISGSVLARGAYAALHKLQIARKDFPVIGHNLYLGNENYVPLFSISPQSTRIGISAFNILEKLMAGETASSIYLPPVLKKADLLFSNLNGEELY